MIHRTGTVYVAHDKYFRDYKAFHFLKAPNHFEIFCFTNQLEYFEWQRSSIHKLFVSQQFTKKWKAPKRCLCLKQIHIGEQSLVH